MSTDHGTKVELAASMTSTARVHAEASIIRGNNSWHVLLTFLGFSLTITGTLISMIDVLLWWARIGIFALAGGLLWWAFLHSGKFQDRFLGWYLRNSRKVHR